MEIRRVSIRHVSPLALALAATLTVAGSLHAQTSLAWIERSNADAKTLLDVIARFSPESASEFGLSGYDDKTADLKPVVDQRSHAALVSSAERQCECLVGSL